MRLHQYTRRDVAGKRVLLRADLDIKGKVDQYHDLRLERLVPVIKELLSWQVKQIILLGHRGRPKGKDAKLSLRPVRQRLLELLASARVNEQIFFVKDIAAKTGLALGRRIVMLENLRFWPGEKSGSKEFAKKLSRWGDVYINNAFGNCHRADASMTFLAKLFVHRFAGPGVIEEVNNLSAFLRQAGRPFIAVIGGAKISDKLELLKTLLGKTDKILIGGGLGNALLSAKGFNIGRSYTEKVSPILTREVLASDKIKLPLDVAVGSAKRAFKKLEEIKPDDYIGDLGPETIRQYEQEIKKARTIIWNGPSGQFEKEIFRQGSYAIARAIAHATARSLIGGAETVEIAERLNLVKKFSFVSVGGGATLTFLAGGRMPGLETLANN